MFQHNAVVCEAGTLEWDSISSQSDGETWLTAQRSLFVRRQVDRPARVVHDKEALDGVSCVNGRCVQAKSDRKRGNRLRGSTAPCQRSSRE
jgi:hypothetical protein